jgi:hypothetical protein
MQNTGVNFGMQSFHSAIEHFRKTSKVLNRHDRDPNLNQGFCRSASGKNFDPERRKATGKLNNSTLIAHANERATDFRHVGLLGNRLVEATFMTAKVGDEDIPKGSRVVKVNAGYYGRAR